MRLFAGGRKETAKVVGDGKETQNRKLPAGTTMIVAAVASPEGDRRNRRSSVWNVGMQEVIHFTGPPPAPTTGPPPDPPDPPDHHLHPPPDHRRTTVGPPSAHHLHPSAHWTTDASPPYHRRTTTVSEIRMTLIYEADAEADEEMLTLMSKSSTTSPSDFLSPILVSVTPTFLSQFDSRFTSMAFDPLDGINGGDDCRIVENPNGMSLFDLCEVSVC
ncbi:hypothetical protein LXL04_028834 [Taraxacum kok-saghyz]